MNGNIYSRRMQYRRDRDYDDSSEHRGHRRKRSDNQLDGRRSPDADGGNDREAKKRAYNESGYDGMVDIDSCTSNEQLLRRCDDGESQQSSEQEACPYEDSCETCFEYGRCPFGSAFIANLECQTTATRTIQCFPASSNSVPKEDRFLINVSKNLSTGREPPFERLDLVDQRGEMWGLIRDGNTDESKGYTNERDGSSGVSDPGGGGQDTAPIFVLYRSFQKDTDAKFKGNMFTIRGNVHEPCIRILEEHLTNCQIFDGGYWVPKNQIERDLRGDSPDGIWVKFDKETNQWYLYGTSEYKYVMSPRYEIPLYHLIQCQSHNHATASAICRYFSVWADEKYTKDGWVEGEPFLRQVLYLWVHYHEEFMKFIFIRADGARECVRWNKKNPWACILPQWTMLQFDGKRKVKSLRASVEELSKIDPLIQDVLSKYPQPDPDTWMLQCLEASVICEKWNAQHPDSTIGPAWPNWQSENYLIQQEREFDIKIEKQYVNVHALNEERIFANWKDDPNPDGIRWWSAK